MWELVLSGIGIAGTGRSLLSGFSLAKKVDQIAASVDKLEQLYQQLSSQVTDGPGRNLEQAILPILESFKKQQDPQQQIETARILQEYSRQVRSDLERSTSALLGEAITEMKSIVDSARLAEAPPVPPPSNFVNTLYENPFQAGLLEFEDISTRGLWGVEKPQIIDRHSTPLHWVNPISGRSFLGRITLEELRRYGIKVEAPKYRKLVDGHVYSGRYGLYLPSYIVEM